MLQIVKGALRHLLYHPRGMTIGASSTVARPRTIYNAHCIRIGERTSVGQHSVFNLITQRAGESYTPSLVIGDDVYVGHYCQFHIMNRVELGDGCVLSDYIHVSDTEHGFNPNAGKILDQPVVSKGPVKIGKNCFVGLGSSILANVTLGDWCIVGARSVVQRSFPGYCIVVGAPAKIVRRWSPEQGAWIPASA